MRSNTLNRVSNNPGAVQHRYLDGEIKKEEWRENMRRIEDMLARQQALPLSGDKLDDPRLAGSISEN